MKQETAIQLLDIAAKLAEAAMHTKHKTASQKTSVAVSAEAVFEDCLSAVTAHFADLIGSQGSD